MSTSQHESLRDIAQIAQQRHDGAGGRQMQRIAEQAGKTMSPTTFDRIAAGIYRSKPQEKTLEALAYLAGISVKRVYDAAGRKYVAAKFADQLPPDVDELNEDQREALIYVARAFLKTNREKEQLQHELEKLQSKPTPLRPVDGQYADAEDLGFEQKMDLAAHPEFELEQDRFEWSLGDDGEGSQVPPGED